jgi:hypothetical protein
MEHTPKNTIQLTKKEFTNYLNNALCNGMYYFDSYALVIDYKDEHYKIAKEELKKDFEKAGFICIEDVWTKMLEMEFPINIIDEECNGTYSITMFLDIMYSNLQYVPLNSLVNIINGKDDSVDNDAFLQAVIYKDVIFG